MSEIGNAGRGPCNVKRETGELEEEHNSIKISELEFILTGVLTGLSGEGVNSNLISFGQLNTWSCHLMECRRLWADGGFEKHVRSVCV